MIFPQFKTVLKVRYSNSNLIITNELKVDPKLIKNFAKKNDAKLMNYQWHSILRMEQF